MRNPFRGVVDYISEMQRMADAMATMDSSSTTQDRGFSDAWTPTTDIYAHGTDLVIQCEVPGVQPDELEVALSHGHLSITGERHRAEEGLQYYANERYYGAFRREISLPEDVTEDRISADFEEGLLTVTVRGGAESQGPKQISVRSRKRAKQAGQGR
ncbi:Hsp20/alpha crystallin family protein [Spiractinospora alimapuensis]|uniref:Hsp20/alpha crystallin family protein n=1 Tax=Spiractinospora alimapuensis TaxID=2820884 RepID=UPI002ED531CB